MKTKYIVIAMFNWLRIILGIWNFNDKTFTLISGFLQEKKAPKQFVLRICWEVSALQTIFHLTLPLSQMFSIFIFSSVPGAFNEARPILRAYILFLAKNQRKEKKKIQAQ